MPAVLEAKVSPVKKYSFTVRCYVYEQRSGLFVAECIDLDLMVKSRNPAKAKRELRDAILGYVQVAVESGQDKVLIPRRSPLGHRLHYFALYWISRFSRTKRDRVFNCTPETSAVRCYA
jgi:hypothetical protein